jgi:hypothetical protein
MSFALRATQRLFKSPLIGSTLDLLHCLSARTVRLCNYLLVFSIQQFGMLQFSHHSLLELNDRLCSYPFGLQHCLTAYRLSTDGTCFRCKSESSLTQACLDGPLLAAVCRKPAFGCIAALTLNGR